MTFHCTANEMTDVCDWSLLGGQKFNLKNEFHSPKKPILVIRHLPVCISSAMDGAEIVWYLVMLMAWLLAIPLICNFISKIHNNYWTLIFSTSWIMDVIDNLITCSFFLFCYSVGNCQDYLKVYTDLINVLLIICVFVCY